MTSNRTNGGDAHPLAIILPLTTFYVVVFCFAVAGNILILVAIWRSTNMRTVVNLFLANLACSDLLFITLSMFDVVAYLLNGWFAGEAFCKIQCFVIETSYTCSVLTLVAVSLERYFSICHPHMKRRTKKANMVAVGFLWLLSALFCAVLLYAYTTRRQGGRTVCENDLWTKSARRVFYTVHSIVVYLFPLTVMLWAHWRISEVVRIPRTSSGLPDKNKNTSEFSDSSDGGKKLKFSIKSPSKKSNSRSGRTRPKSIYKMQGRRRVIRILIVVTASFMAIWTPFIVIRMLLYYGVSINDFLWRSSQLLVLSSTAVNSVIYAFMSPQFRKSFVELVPFLACILDKKQNGSRSYSSSMCQSPRYSESQENSSSNTRDCL